MLSVTLLFSKVSRQVLCVEAGKEFVDFLVAFLTLPVGCIVKLLGDASMLTRVGHYYSDAQLLQQNYAVMKPACMDTTKEKTIKCCPDKVMTSMANVFDSVQRFADSRTLCINKKFLLDPKPVGGHGAPLLAAMTTAAAAAEDLSGRNLAAAGYYRCGHACIFMTSKLGTTCPKHNRRMETKCKIVQGTPAQTIMGGRSSTGYVGGGTQYMITNTLEIFASSAIQALLKLNLIRSERIGDLDAMEIQCSPKEVLQLLKASLSSTNVLNEVFGKHCAN